MTTALDPASRSSLDLLVLGGTSWLGGAVARSGLRRGHRVTCLARGESGSAPDGVTWVRADRRDPGAYDDVAGRRWDGVIEVSWDPGLVRGALESLADRSRHWGYVSSCSVYADELTVDQSEEAPTLEAYPDDGPVEIEVYGEAKVACEQACLAALGTDRTLVARAGLIGGYGDRSDRLGYWPARLARDQTGPVLVPPRQGPLQVVDVEDLADWLVSSAEERVTGVYNAVGRQTTVGALLETCADTAGRQPVLVEADDQWLLAQEVTPWMGRDSLPLWLPAADYAGFMTRRNDAARRSGLRLRPLAQTVQAALEWETELGLGRERRAGLGPAREGELLARLLEAGSGG